MDDLVTRLRAGVPQKTVRWPGNDGEDIVRDTSGAAASMKEAADMIEHLQKEVAQAYARMTCMCGSYVDQHGIGDGHSPMSQYDYALDRAEQRAYELAVAIMGGEDAPGLANSIASEVLVKQLQKERAERNAWTDACVQMERRQIADDLFQRNGFMTATSNDGKHFVNISFSTMEEMHEFHNALVSLSQAKTAEPFA